jgi:uncharacterized protein YjbI with pentapeptide repeats
MKRNKKQPMSTTSQIPSSNAETADLPLPAQGEPLEAVLARDREGLVPADQLPSAAGVLAELFPPDDLPAPPLGPTPNETGSAAAQDSAPVASAPTPNTVDEPASSQPASNPSNEVADSTVPQAGLQDASMSEPSEVASQDEITSGLSALPAERDGWQPSGEVLVSQEADQSLDPAAAKNGNQPRKSVFSRLLHNVKAAFAGKSKPGISRSSPAAEPEAVEAAAPAEQSTRLDQPASARVPIAEERVMAESGEVSAEASASGASAADRSSGAEIAPAGAGAEVSAPESEEPWIRQLEAQLREDGSSRRPLREEPAAHHAAFSDSAVAEPVFQNEDEVAEDEIVDTSDDDLAIASAIECYANLSDPARANRLEPAEKATVELQSQEPVAEKEDLNAILGIPRDEEPALPSPASSFSATQIQGSGESPVPAIPFTSPVDAEVVTSEVQQEISEQAASESVAVPPAPARSSRDWSFEEKLASHHEWIESKGATGKRIDFATADLEGNDLIGANLRYMDLRDANLRAADLLMADLRDACLVRANFRDACLVGANLEGANLEGASLETSMGLVPHQLAGANLHEAALPPHILPFEALAEFKRASRTVYGYFAAMMSLSMLSWIMIWATKDFQLLTNSSILRFLHSPEASAALPTVQFYLIAPFALFIVYLVFHFHLQHLWDTVLELPAVFPDGRALGENEPRIVVGLLRVHFRWMNQDAPSTRVIEKAISILLAYWIVPATLLFYWLRYLTLQEIHGTVLQEFLVVGASGAALYSTTKVGKPAANWTLDQNVVERALVKLRGINPVTTALVLLGALTFISAGTILGVPHGKDRAPEFGAGSIRRWAPTVLWSFGIDPYADLTEAVISTKPANWSGSDEQVSSVKGARLNDSNFRYAQGYRVFLANAHLLRAKFQGAFLSQADLRSADLGQSDLRYATLDQAQMNHANLDRAVLDGANLSRSDLRAANLSYASLAGATLVDARVDGATLYGAKLASATLIRTNFEKADLRESHLNGANLEHVDMQGAYLWSAKLPGAYLNNAQLGTAIFVDADLRGADLRWAQLSGTVLTGADLTGTLLDGADFRSAVGFGANQICSAKSRKGLLLDAAMLAQVTAQCGAGN